VTSIVARSNTFPVPTGSRAELRCGSSSDRLDPRAEMVSEPPCREPLTSGQASKLLRCGTLDG
jgi:hypothetical protein